MNLNTHIVPQMERRLETRENNLQIQPWLIERKNMVFSSKKFRNGPKYEFMKRHRINEPTDYALILGGHFIEQGEQVEFEHKFDNLRVDLYIPTWSKTIIIEVVGDDRTKSQLESDRNRDCFLSCIGYTVFRIKNSMIEKHIKNQGNKWLLGSKNFEEQINQMMKEEKKTGKRLEEVLPFSENLFTTELDDLF